MIISTFSVYLGYSDSLVGICVADFLIEVVFRPVVGWMLDNGKRIMIFFIGLLGMGLYHYI